MPDRLDIITRLLQDHLSARRVMAALEAEIDRVAQFHPPDLAAINQAAAFFSGPVAEMHHHVEDMILTALTREAPAQAAEIKKVADEHSEAGALVSQLIDAAAGLAVDADRGRSSFCRAARSMIAFQRHHMRREENRFFDYAREHLSPMSWRSINVTAKKLEATQASFQMDADAAGRKSATGEARRRVTLKR